MNQTTFRRCIWRCLWGLLCVHTLWAGIAYGQHSTTPVVPAPAAPALYGAEIIKQESIYQSKGTDVPAGYSIDRTLEEYTRGLTANFGRSLAALGPGDRWLDVGAGTGQAILDYYAANYDVEHPQGSESRGRKAKTVALSIEDRRTQAWHQTAARLDTGQLQYLFGKRLRDYSLEDLGKFRLITDVLGGFSYTDNVSGYMEKVLDFLEVGGSFYGVLQDVGAEAGVNKPFYPNARFLTEILNADASSVKICAWIKSIACVRATCEFKTDWKPPLEMYRIRKECNEVKVPELVRVHYEAGTPPERRFQLKQLLAPAADRDSAR